MKKIFLFVLAWFLLSLVQSFFTEIVDDEAYYWVYSLKMDWGYFDHPPMIALLIKIGYFLFPGELGVRLLPSLLGAGTLFLVFLMLKDKVKDLRLLMLVSLSIPLVHGHVAGFLALPDLPLVFFATLFFFFYRRYLERESPWTVIWLAFSIAMMLYSKYHAFLVIAFTVLSNLKLLLRRSFWVLVLISLVLYLPHIIWQIKNDFVSFGYHLVDRNAPFAFKHMFEYLGNQIIMVGPFCGIILFYMGFSRRAEDKFESALKFNLIGFFGGFLFSSLKGHVEPHWTAFAVVPLILLSVPEIEKHLRLKKWVKGLSYASIVLIAIMRLTLMFDFGIYPDHLSQRFFNQEEYYHEIQEVAGDRPVIFSNTYQRTSLYWFYTGKPAFSRNDKFYRRNQYDLMGMEADLHGTEVLLCSRYHPPGCDSLKNSRQNFLIHHTSHFSSFNRVDIKAERENWEFDAGEWVQIDLELGNPTDRAITFTDSLTFPPELVYTYYSDKPKGRTFFARYDSPLPDLAPGEYRSFPIEIRMPHGSGEFQLAFSFAAKDYPSGINGRPVSLSVHSRSRAN